MQVTSRATISFRKPITAPVLIPVEHKSTPACINDPFMADGKCYRVTALSLGSPHGAVLVDNIEDVDVPTLGASLGRHPLFPQGASIVFIQALDGENIKARLWRRNKGETAFDPEAACVAGVASMMLHKTIAHHVNVSMGGSTFQVKWDRIGAASLTGPRNNMEAILA